MSNRTVIVTPVGGVWRERALEAEAENAALHERLAAADRLNASLSEWGNRGWARVAELAARTRRLLRLAKYWRAPGRKSMSEREKAVMMVRYVELGGLERGKGIGAVEQVAHEFERSSATVNRCIREFKSRVVTRSEALKIVENYRRRYGS